MADLASLVPVFAVAVLAFTMGWLVGKDKPRTPDAGSSTSSTAYTPGDPRA